MEDKYARQITTAVAAMLLNDVWDSYHAKHIHGKVDINESGKCPNASQRNLQQTTEKKKKKSNLQEPQSQKSTFLTAELLFSVTAAQKEGFPETVFSSHLRMSCAKSASQRQAGDLPMTTTATDVTYGDNSPWKC